MVKNLFDKFLRSLMIALFTFSIIVSILINLGLNFIVYNEVPIGMKFVINIFSILIILLGLSAGYYKRDRIVIWLQKLLNIKNLIFFVMLASFIIRILWITLVQTIPVSDFAMMYNSAKEVFGGNFSCFHGFNYFARFPHDTITVLYYSLFYNFNENPLFLIKLFNVLFSTLSIFIMYSIVKQLLGYKSAVVSAILLSLFPPFVMYTSQMLSENMAIPFYLISIYFFIKYIKNMNKYRWIIFSGLALSVANMFRSVGIIFIIAYIMYFVIYKGIKRGVKVVPIIIVMFILPLYVTSTLLLNNKIIESHLWQPKETPLTSILRGTNLKSFGFWNEEDSNMPSKYNYDETKVKEESLKLIEQRLLHSPIQNVVALYIVKLGGQLGVSDFGAFEFTVINSNSTLEGEILKYFTFTTLTLINIFHIFLLYFSVICLKKKKKLSSELNLLLILSLGFICLYLISEVQPRYSFIICWTLVIFAAGGLKEKNILKNIIKQENTLEIPNTEEIITTLRSNESLED